MHVYFLDLFFLDLDLFFLDLDLFFLDLNLFFLDLDLFFLPPKDADDVMGFFSDSILSYKLYNGNILLSINRKIT